MLCAASFLGATVPLDGGPRRVLLNTSAPGQNNGESLQLVYDSSWTSVAGMTR